MPALAIVNPNFTASGASIVPAQMIGGTPANPVSAVVSTLFATVPANGMINADAAENFYYFSDGNGNLYQTTPAGVSTQIWAYGSTQYLTAIPSPDGSKIYILLKNNTIIQVLTSAPYTATVVVGTAGTAALTDGVGTAASIKIVSYPTGFWYSNDKTLLYFIDTNGTNPVVRQIALSNFAVTTLNVYTQGNLYNTPKLSAAGNYYSGNNGQVIRYNFFNNTASLLGTLAGVTTGGSWEMVPDPRVPFERCIYCVGSTNTGVFRFDTLTGISTQIATLPTTANTGAKQCLLWRNNHLLVEVASSNSQLIKVA